jgi:hypothetical protein
MTQVLYSMHMEKYRKQEMQVEFMDEETEVFHMNY